MSPAVVDLSMRLSLQNDLETADHFAVAAAGEIATPLSQSY
jgi:hypothetical protein